MAINLTTQVKFSQHHFETPIQLFSDNELDYVVDVSIAYPNNVPQNEKDILQGNFPTEVHFDTQCYSYDQIPDDKEKWCKDLWTQKEQTLKTFYTGNKTFSREQVDTSSRLTEEYVELYLLFALLFWGVFQVGATVSIMYFSLVRWYVLISVIFFTTVGKFGGMGELLATSV